MYKQSLRQRQVNGMSFPFRYTPQNPNYKPEMVTRYKFDSNFDKVTTAVHYYLYYKFLDDRVFGGTYSNQKLLGLIKRLLTNNESKGGCEEVDSHIYKAPLEFQVMVSIEAGNGNFEDCLPMGEGYNSDPIMPVDIIADVTSTVKDLLLQFPQILDTHLDLLRQQAEENKRIAVVDYLQEIKDQVEESQETPAQIIIDQDQLPAARDIVIPLR